MKVIKYLLIIVAGVLLSLVVLSILTMFVTKNNGVGGTFISPSGHFEFAVPASMLRNGKHSDREHEVVFLNRTCEMYQVVYGNIPDVELPLLAQLGRSKFEEYYLRLIHVDRFLQRGAPGGEITVDFVEYQQNLHGGNLYAQLDIPEGSLCKIGNSAASARRVNAKWGILVIMHDGQIYAVTSALSAESIRAGSSDKTAALSGIVWNDTLREKLKSQTLGFAKSIQFFKQGSE